MSENIKWMRRKEVNFDLQRVGTTEWRPFCYKVKGSDSFNLVHEDIAKMLSREPRILVYNDDSLYGDLQAIIQFIRQDERRKIHEETSRGKEVKGKPKKSKAKTKAKKGGKKEESSEKVKQVSKRKVKGG